MNSLIAMTIDRSGSMQVAWPATARGFNAFLTYQQMRIDDCEMTLSFFNHFVQEIYPWGPVFKLAKLDPTKDMTDGSTSLWTAVTHTITKVDKRTDKLTPEAMPPSILVVIQTDGGEVAYGDEFNLAKKEVKDRLDKGWHFLWLAAGGQAVKAADDLGIPKAMVIPYELQKSEETFTDLGRKVLEASVTGKWQK